MPNSENEYTLEGRAPNTNPQVEGEVIWLHAQMGGGGATSWQELANCNRDVRLCIFKGGSTGLICNAPINVIPPPPTSERTLTRGVTYCGKHPSAQPALKAVGVHR